MAGEIEHPRLRRAQFLGEGTDPQFQRMLRKVVSFHDLEAHGAELGRDICRIVVGIGECRRMVVVRDADDQRDAARCCLTAYRSKEQAGRNKTREHPHGGDIITGTRKLQIAAEGAVTSAVSAR